MFEAGLQFLVNGLVTGCFYALIALGLTLIFGMMGVVNFAHGEFFVLGGVFAYWFVALMGLPFWLAVILVVVVMALLGAAFAGALLGAIFVVHPSTAEVATLKAFGVVILGGMGSFPGAVAGGLILGIVESLWGGYFSTGYQDVIGFVLVILILLFKPTGLFSGSTR